MFVDVHQQQIDNAKKTDKTDKTDKSKTTLRKRKLDNKRLSARTAQQGGADQQNDSSGVSAVLSLKITELRAVPTTNKNVKRTTSPISKVLAPARAPTKTPLCCHTEGHITTTSGEATSSRHVPSRSSPTSKVMLFLIPVENSAHPSQRHIKKTRTISTWWRRTANSGAHPLLTVQGRLHVDPSPKEIAAVQAIVQPTAANVRRVNIVCTYTVVSYSLAVMNDYQ